MQITWRTMEWRRPHWGAVLAALAAHCAMLLFTPCRAADAVCEFRAFRPRVPCHCPDDYLQKPLPLTCQARCCCADCYQQKPLPPAPCCVPGKHCDNYCCKSGFVWLFKGEPWYRCVPQRLPGCLEAPPSAAAPPQSAP